MKKEYGHILIEELTELGANGEEYFSDISRDDANKIISKLKQITKDFVLANGCQIDLVDYKLDSELNPEFGFHIINRQEIGLIKVYYVTLYQKEETNESDFRQVFEAILADFFQIENPAGLLEKVSDKDSGDDYFKMTIEGRLK